MQENILLDATMRALGAALRAVRLYPPGSPMSAQAAEKVCKAVEEYVQAEPSLKLDVVREGFILRGVDGVFTAPGIPDLADALGSHGVGELHFVAPPAVDEVVTFLDATQHKPQDLVERGGIQTALSQAGVESIKVISVVLSKIETPPEIPEEEADKFLAELAADANRLALWLRSLLASEDEGLAEGILVLANAAVDVRVFGRTMAAAFLELETADKDRLLEVSIHLEPIRHVMVEMLANLSATELVAAIRGGRYGTNLSAVSFALTALPLETRFEELLGEMKSALQAADVNPKQIEFLERMVALRCSETPEPPLAQSLPVLGVVQEAINLRPAQDTAVREAATDRARMDAKAAATAFELLTLADDLTAYGRVLGALAASVPHLLEEGVLDVAMSVVREISQRSVTSKKPWPGLTVEFERAIETACGVRSMSALLAMGASSEPAIECARELVTLGGEAAPHNLASAAMESDAEDSMEFAEAVLGRRLPELLAPEAPRAEARHATKLAGLFARDGGSRCMQALSQLAARPEDHVRSETARGIAAAGGAALTALMPRLLRDQSQAVALVAARTLARNGGPGSAEMLAQRLVEIDSEHELPVAREIIGLLAKSPSPAAAQALGEIAGRGKLLRKHWRSEMRKLATEALEARPSGGA